jgi:hypothetical protein
MRLIPGAFLTVSLALLASGCALPLLTDKYERVQDCVENQKKLNPPNKYTDEQLHRVCRLWDGQKQLDNSGNYKPTPQPAPQPAPR